MSREFIRLAQRVADLERRVRGMCRYGTVEEVDPGAGTVRLKLGEGADGNPFLTAPIPYAQTAGAVKFHNPPSKGQQMVAMSPDGDLRQALAQPMGFSSSNPSPSGAGDQHVMTFGGFTGTMTGDALKIEAPKVEFITGGVTHVLDGSGLHVTGGTVDHNGTDIGDTHTHSGVLAGPARTGDPK